LANDASFRGWPANCHSSDRFISRWGLEAFGQRRTDSSGKEAKTQARKVIALATGEEIVFDSCREEQKQLRDCVFASVYFCRFDQEEE
jgi:hypothetical protein